MGMLHSLSANTQPIYKWANSGIDESSSAEVKADVEGHNMAKTAGKEEMSKGYDKQQAIKSFSSPNHETF